MNIIEMLLNYLDISKFLVVLTIFFLILVTTLLLTSDPKVLFDEPKIQKKRNSKSCPIKQSEKSKEAIDNGNRMNDSHEIEFKGFFQNKIEEAQKKFILSNELVNLNTFSEKITIFKNNSTDKNDELSKLFIESLSSLNSWKNNKVENKLFKKINWGLEKRENNNDEDESLVLHYVSPIFKENEFKSSNNLSSSQISINSNSETDDEEELKEKALLSEYKLGICRIFEKTEENEIKSNIVKVINESLYKVYCEGNVDLIKAKCRKETIPENYNEIVEKYKKDGYNAIGLGGKKMKINYFQSQRIERLKCESNLTFLGFVVYKENYDGYKCSYS